MPVRDFLADESGDLAVANGDFGFAGGDTVEENQQAVRQGIQCRTNMLQGECFLAPDEGVPWLTEILVKDPDPTTVASDIADAINATPDVVAVEVGTLTVTPQRAASIPYVAQTAYSTQQLSGTASPPIVPQGSGSQP